MADTQVHNHSEKRKRGGQKRPLIFDLFGQLKQCSICSRVRSVTHFYRDSRSTDRYSNRCKCCESEMGRQRIAKLTPELRARRYESYIKHAAKSFRARANGLVNGVKQRCKRNGRITEITPTFIEEKLRVGWCEATGIAFRYEKAANGKGGMTPFSPSIDRIDSDRDYQLDNVALVCTAYNIGKLHHNEIDFIAMCMAVARRHENNKEAIDRLEELLK